MVHLKLQLVTIKANFLHQSVLLNQVLTHVALAHRGVPVGSTLCPLCNSFDEGLDHIFAYCTFARELWSHTGICLKLRITHSSSIDGILDTNLYDLKNGSSKKWLNPS